jgi:hypothetical protein
MTSSRGLQKKPAHIELLQHLGQPVNSDTCFLNELDLALELYLIENEFF